MRDRKHEHIELTNKSQVLQEMLDPRFNYEPLFGRHQFEPQIYKFLDFNFSFPMWISSMTGGTGSASHINKNLAHACDEFSLGMGLGSCRTLLKSDQYFADFNLRENIGERPLFANIGICQLDELLQEGSLQKLDELIDQLKANGLFIHINPLQELIQPEGDTLVRSPHEILKDFLSKKSANFRVIVKEVGQGMGPKSLEALLDLEIDGIEFSAFGGTNFAQMEMFRSSESSHLEPLIRVGHDVYEMIKNLANILKNKSSSQLSCRNFIFSGGIVSSLDGFYCLELFKKLMADDHQNYNVLFAQASKVLNHADGEYEKLKDYLQRQQELFYNASAFLQIKD